MEKIYSYVNYGEDSSDNFDRAYYLIGDFFPHESISLGYELMLNNVGHKLYVRMEEVAEDRTFFELSTGLHLTEDMGQPRRFERNLEDNLVTSKQWLKYEELKKYVRIKPREVLFT